MRTRLFGFLFCVLLTACQNNASINHDISVIDGNSQSKIVISDLFSKSSVIPLQTTNQSLVGLMVKEAKRMHDKLFLLNQIASRTNLLCFDTTGRFVRLIDRIGYGPQEYTYLGDIIPTPDSNALILTTEKGKYLVLDTADNYLSTIQQEPPYYYAQQFLRINDSTCLVFHNGDFPSGSDLLEIDARTFAIRRSVQARDIMDLEGGRPLSLWNGRVLYCALSDTIYDATDIQNRRPLYWVDFGDAHRALLDKQRKFRLEGDREQMLKLALNPAFCLVTRLFENSRWIALSGLKKPKSNASGFLTFFILYNKETGRSYHSEHISWDILNIGPLEQVEIVGGDMNGTLYAVWYGTLSEEQKQRLKASDRLSPALKTQLLTREDEDNPVLFLLR